MAIVLCISPNSWCSFLVRTTARGSAIDRSIATDHRSPCDPSPCPSALQEKSASCLPALRSLRRPRRSSRNLVLWAVVDAIQPATAGPVCGAGIRRRWGRSRPGCASPVVSLTGFEPTLRP
jgi:hypothetical protein